MLFLLFFIISIVFLIKSEFHFVEVFEKNELALSLVFFCLALNLGLFDFLNDSLDDAPHAVHAHVTLLGPSDGLNSVSTADNMLGVLAHIFS